MWFKKKEYPMFKIDLNLYIHIAKPKYVLKKFDPFARFKFDPYDVLGVYDTHEEAVAMMEHYIEYPQYFDKTGKRVG